MYTCRSSRRPACPVAISLPSVHGRGLADSHNEERGDHESGGQGEARTEPCRGGVFSGFSSPKIASSFSAPQNMNKAISTTGKHNYTGGKPEKLG